MASIVKGAIKKNIIDWGFVLANCGPAMKKPITDTITRNEELARLIREARENKPRLNFENYTRALQLDSEGSNFVSSCQKAAQSFVSPIDAGAATARQEQLALIQKEHEKMTEETNAYLIKLQEEMQQIRTKLDKFASLNDIDEVTVSTT